MPRGTSASGIRPGYTGHRIPDWSKQPIWGKGSPGVQGKARGRRHILDPRTKNAPPVGADVASKPSGPHRGKKARGEISPW